MNNNVKPATALLAASLSLALLLGANQVPDESQASDGQKPISQVQTKNAVVPIGSTLTTMSRTMTDSTARTSASTKIGEMKGICNEAFSVVLQYDVVTHTNRVVLQDETGNIVNFKTVQNDRSKIAYTNNGQDIIVTAAKPKHRKRKTKRRTKKECKPFS